MSETRAIAITVSSGALGLVVGAVVALALIPASHRAAVGLPLDSVLLALFAGAGFVVGPWTALRRSRVVLAEVTTALASVWMMLLILAVGPTLQAIGPAWLSVGLAPVALAIARVIAGPFAPYVAVTDGPTAPR